MQPLRIGRALAHAGRGCAAPQLRWNTASAHASAPPAQAEAKAPPSSERAAPERESAGGMNAPALFGLGVTGVAFFAWLKWMATDRESEARLKKVAAERRERQAAGESRADPALLRKSIMSRLQFVDPQASSEIVQLGMRLAVYGPSDALKSHPQWETMAALKAESGAMSWADLGGFVAFIGLEEMGAPTAMVKPKFGRSPSETARRAMTMKPCPPPDATYEECKAFGDQFGLTESELVAALGGQANGSLLFGNTRQPNVDVALYRDPTPDMPYAAVFNHSDFTKKACQVFGDDQLYFNLYFASALEKVLAAGWGGLQTLPDRLINSTNDQSWASRQRAMYGVTQEYVGADTNYNQR
eukprot:TRINITY_DN20829_c0_g1_i1.p1 TRINITY_DN20829_c0_g1~~TRINITY_DN20829_c0_g1_i1.p1  ORF type:complete len:378 (+),score=142.19 TRINITY_DN20829_c0_g1_i1:66-1136(+)